MNEFKNCCKGLAFVVVAAFFVYAFFPITIPYGIYKLCQARQISSVRGLVSYLIRSLTGVGTGPNVEKVVMPEDQRMETFHE